MSGSVISWIVTEGTQYFLCVLEPHTGPEKPKFYRFPTDLRGLARLSAEASATIVGEVQRRD